MQTFPALQTLHLLLQKIITSRDKVLLSSKKVTFYVIFSPSKLVHIRVEFGSLVWTTYLSYRSFLHDVQMYYINPRIMISATKISMYNLEDMVGQY